MLCLGGDALHGEVFTRGATCPGLEAKWGGKGFLVIAGRWDISASSLLSSRCQHPRRRKEKMRATRAGGSMGAKQKTFGAGGIWKGKEMLGSGCSLGRCPQEIGNHIPLEIRFEAHEDSEHGDPAMALIFLQLFLQMVPMRPGATGRSLCQPSPHPRLLCLQEPGKPEPRANTTCHRHLQPL